ncbi:unnamed protein product [Caenorhabditis sp. 36 PRJEB53466]|nr:unnamed protein product [Caenorhabditis sp. 36 PRJEB53466]
MTINPPEQSRNPLEELPLTPRPEGKVQFLSPDTVKYTSPPRIEVPRQPIRPDRPVAPAPTYSSPPMESAPPSYYSTVNSPPLQAYPQAPLPSSSAFAPQMVQMAPPSMVYMPQIPQMMSSPLLMQAPPTLVNLAHVAPQQQTSPTITLNINQSPQSVTSLGGSGGGGALICPKCRKGIITRKQDRFRKRLLMCLAIGCCPVTCCLPLLCLFRNYVDTCACCGKNYGHRGRKNHKKNVNAVKL